METPWLAVDCAIFDDIGRVVLIRRNREPFKGGYALPGGFVEIGETVEDACRREVKEETNLELHELRLVGVYSDPGRDPRGHVVSIAFTARADVAPLKAGDDASQAEMIENWRERPLAFDHRRILEDAFRIIEKSR